MLDKLMQLLEQVLTLKDIRAADTDELMQLDRLLNHGHELVLSELRRRGAHEESTPSSES
jgi:hypothetical protein